jgi:lauroyl/myristoyl acyltransferase
LGLPPLPVLAYQSGSTVAQAIPASLFQGVASAVAVAASNRRPSLLHRRQLVGRHLQRALGELTKRDLDAAVDAAFASYARYWAESLRLPGSSAAEIDAGMSWEGIGRITRAVRDGRGAILALPHLGGWEWGGFWMVQQGFAMTVVVEALEPPELFEWFAGFRRSLGMEVVAVGSSAAMTVVRALRAGGVVCLLCDRNVGRSGGVDVEFFGERTELPAGPATLALRTGAALLPSAVYFEGEHGHRAVVRPEIPVRPVGRGGGSVATRHEVGRVSQTLAGELEVLIRHAPTQWHLMQPNWPSDPGYSR